MNKNDIWNLFKITGNPIYYLKYREMTKKEMSSIENNESKRNNS